MPDKPLFESIEAVDIELADRVSERPPTVSPGKSKKPLVLAVLGGLLLATVAIVIFLLPDWVADRPVTSAAESKTVQVTEETPYLQAQLAEARKKAQDILGSLIEAQQALADKKAKQWATNEITQVNTLAAEGDQVYRQGQFDQALDLYGQALELANSLLKKSETLIDDKLQEGAAAIDSANQAAAVAAFELVLTIEPENQSGQQGLARAQLMTKTTPLLEQAQQAMEENQWQAAQQHLQKALALDGGLTQARSWLATVQQKLKDEAFSNAMSAGFHALESGHYADAVNHFTRATSLKPGNQDAGASLDQARAENQRQFVSRTLSEAADLEAGEHWAQAVVAYNKVLASDNSVVEARVGQLRASARQSLGEQIDKILSDPMRLASNSVYQEGRQLLADANQIDPPGATLQDQITRLTVALAKALKPVRVTLSSDNKTSVTLLRIAELGVFEQHQLELRPGRYIALGSRPGFRDVRVAFEVTAGANPQVSIVCSERV